MGIFVPEELADVNLANAPGQLQRDYPAFSPFRTVQEK